MSSRERGSALLIVFLFAAIVAIMLYMEMPVAAFEAQRQKEQLLIDRGNEYSHAVKLFVRRMGTYPTSIDQLEDTNRMRFLRHRFKEPFTGKDNWRLLHAGPGGMLIDSKVNPINQNNQNGSGTAGSSNSTFGSTSNFASSSFGNNSSSSFGSSSDSSSNQVQVAPIPQRAPAIAANGASATGEAQNVAADPNSISPIPAPGQAAQVGNAQNPPGQPPVQSNAQPAGVADPANTTPMLRNLLQNPNAPLPQTPGNSQNSPQMGTISNGGIAGIASKAEGHSIKTVKDQTDYSLWEFYYDPTKDALRGMPGNVMPGNVPAGAAPAANTNTGAFGSNSWTFISPSSQTQLAPATTPPPTPPNQPPVVPPPNPPPE